MISGTINDSAEKLLQVELKRAFGITAKIRNSNRGGLYNYSTEFYVTINDKEFLFSTKVSTFEEAAKELVDVAKLKSIPNMWFKATPNIEISDTVMLVLSEIFYLKYITIGGLFYNHSENLYGQDVYIHNNLERLIFTEDEAFDNLRRVAADWFIDKYPEYLI